MLKLDIRFYTPSNQNLFDKINNNFISIDISYRIENKLNIVWIQNLTR